MMRRAVCIWPYVEGKNISAMYAACLYISCRQEGTNRTFKEICGGATNTTVKEIGKCYKFIVREIDGRAPGAPHLNARRDPQSRTGPCIPWFNNVIGTLWYQSDEHI